MICVLEIEDQTQRSHAPHTDIHRQSHTIKINP